MTSVRRTTGMLAAAAVSAGLVAFPATGALGAVNETCQGVPTTLVGTPGQPLNGTDERDVIVTNGATVVTALAGNDLVCATGAAPTIQAGGGDDVVDASAITSGTVTAWLGGGADTYTGSPVKDVVYTGGQPTAPATEMVDEDVDTVNTGAGDDVVVTGQAGKANGDTIDAGDGADEVTFLGIESTTSAAVAGGPGDNTLVLPLGPGAWAFDNSAGTGTHDGKSLVRFSGFLDFEFPEAIANSLTFTGGPGPETVRIDDDEDVAQTGIVSVALGGGADFLHADADAATGSRYDGGDGVDTIEVIRGAGEMELNLRGKKFFNGPADSTPDARVTDFRHANLSAEKVVAKADDDANRIAVRACTSLIKGRDGSDELGYYYFPGRKVNCSVITSKIQAGKGQDVLRGTPGDDILIGNKGPDKASGGAGRDVCRTEKRQGCELR